MAISSGINDLPHFLQQWEVSGDISGLMLVVFIVMLSLSFFVPSVYKGRVLLYTEGREGLEKVASFRHRAGS